jgi:type I restriction enzyme M protein
MAKQNNGAVLGFEKHLWLAADALRSNMDAAEYKHVVLGLIFLKYISDAFEEHHTRLAAEQSQGADPEDKDEYRAVNVFWVPQEARWSVLKANAKQSEIGRLVDDALIAIERDNPTLKGVLPKEYARPALDKQRLGQLIDLVSNIGLGDEASRSKDVLGRVYEYFLSQFASAEGKKGGQFYTPRHVVRLLVEMLAPYKGRVYDPCCGSGGMFVQSAEFVQAHRTGNGNGSKAVAGVSVFGQESNPTTWRLATLALRTRTASIVTCIRTSRRTTYSPIRRSTIATGAATACAMTSGGCTAPHRHPTPTSPGCSTSSTTSRPPAWPASYWPTGQCPPISPARERYGRRSSRPIWWTA